LLSAVLISLLTCFISKLLYERCFKVKPVQTETSYAPINTPAEASSSHRPPTPSAPPEVLLNSLPRSPTNCSLYTAEENAGLPSYNEVFGNR